MDGFDAFKQHLQDALTRLYDPTFWPDEIVWSTMGLDPQQGPESIQAALIRAIEDLKPAPDVPSNANVRRVYQLLSYRYVHGLTQEEAAERLSITPRHLRRGQRKAVHALARRLWEQSPMAAQAAERLGEEDKGLSLESAPLSGEPPEWLSQVREELASLQKSAPGAMADVEETIRGAVELGSTFSAKHGVSLAVEQVQPDLVAMIHPSALRQIMIAAIGKLVQDMTSGQITLRAEREGQQVRVHIAGRPVASDRPPDSSLIREILATQGGSVEISTDGDRIAFCVTLMSADRIAVLVVDDNLDLVHFYRRYADGTRYRIVHAPQGQRVLEAIETSPPDIIVLDVMLPDVDGWELLALLHRHPASRSIPIVVCSVVREEELAISLGAARYLPKPVRRRQFIQALDQVLSQAPAEGPRAPASNAAPD